MSEELILYTHPMSRGRVARWMLEEVGAPYRAEVLAFGPAMKSADYLAINPMGKVPAIRHGQVVVSETPAICAYLADAFPQAGLAPAPADRGAYYRWLFFAAGPLETAWINQAFGLAIPEGKEGQSNYGSFARVMDALDYALSQGDYVAGDRFTAADVYIGSQVGYGMQFGGFDKRPSFTRYLERVSARPAWARASAMDDALMPAKA
jgi:glutathione S-transferase